MLANLLRCALKFQRDVVVIGATANKTNSNCDRMVKCVQCEWKMMITGVLFMISAPFYIFLGPAQDAQKPVSRWY